MFLMFKSFFWFVKAEIDMAQNFEHKQKKLYKLVSRLSKWVKFIIMVPHTRSLMEILWIQTRKKSAGNH